MGSYFVRSPVSICRSLKMCDVEVVLLGNGSLCCLTKGQIEQRKESVVKAFCDNAEMCFILEVCICLRLTCHRLPHEISELDNEVQTD